MDVDEFLAHNGIRGMHWGVRKDRQTQGAGERRVKKVKETNGPASSKELRIAAKANYKKQANSILEARIARSFETGAPLRYDQLSTKRTTIAAGRSFYRLTQHKDESTRAMTYVSTNKADRDRYRIAIAEGRGLSLAPKVYKAKNYEATYKSVTQLRSPSEKERVDAFTELLDAKIPVGKHGKTIDGRKLLARSGYGSTLRKIDSQRFGEKYYYAFASNQYMKSPINTAYFNSLKDKGFNALIDDNDRNIVSKEPLMLLDPQGSIKQLNIRRLTNDELNTALATFTSAVPEADRSKPKK